MVTAELGPYSKASETADSVAALSRALTQIGHKVTVALPRPADLEATGLMVARRLTPLKLSDKESVTIYDAALPSGVQVVLVEGPGLEARAGIYGENGEDYEDNLGRFATLCRAALALAQQKAATGAGFDVIHGHDCAGALLALFPSTTPTVFTVHDAGRTCVASWKQLSELGIELDSGVRENLELDGEPHLLKGALLTADVAATTSPTHAAALLDPAHYGELGSALRDAGLEVYGVLGGVDYSVYNSATDTSLAVRFDAEASELKGSCQSAVCLELELPVDPDRPLLFIPATLGSDEAAELIAAAVPSLLKEELQVVALANPGTGAAKKLGAARLRRSKNYRFIESAQAADTRRLFGAADLALFAGFACSGGHAVRVAQRYGAAPIAPAAPGNQDSIVDCDPELLSGTGFLYTEATGDALRGAVSRALAGTRSKNWGALRRRIMRQDLAWERPARRYAQLYRLASQS
ncbi:MAG: hypothetical protein RJA70_2276 [Pseudomonadota bacterium]